MTYFSLQTLSALSVKKVTKAHYIVALGYILKGYTMGDAEDWHSCRAFLTSLAYSDPSRSSAAVRREARRVLAIVSESREELNRKMDHSGSLSDEAIRVFFPMFD